MDISQRFFGLLCVAAIACLPSTVVRAESGVYNAADDGSPAVFTVADIADDVAQPEKPVANCPCGSRSGCRRAACSCQPDAPWTLPQPCLLQWTGFKLGGWVEQGITMNDHHSDDGFNGPVATNDWDDKYQMNQLWLYLDRPAQTHGCGFAWGGHVDMIYGTDWRFGINDGLEDRINGFDYQRYGLVIPQAYLEFAVNNLSVKLGHFAGILDYEAVPCVLNPFYSHSYSYGYTVPQLVTGALAEYKLTDQLALLGGFHRGWLMFEDTNDTLDFMGGVKWASEDQTTKIAYAVSVGPQDPPADFNSIPGDQNRFVYSLVVQQKLFERLQYVLVQNLGTEENAPTTGAVAEWYGLNQYFLYAINPRWSANLRVEWLRDDDGVRVAGPGNIPGVYAWAGHGFAGNFYEVTAGLSWRPTGNLLVRPELRYDWYDGLAGPTGLPFDGGNADDQLTAAVDAIITF
jgi:hypothetical protein